MNNISCIIPSYNNKKLLVKCIESIKNQLDVNDEIIIVDDGSSDGTFELIKKLYKNNLNIRIFKQENKGSGAARNKGIEICNNEFIWFIDSDDYIKFDAFKKIKKTIHKYNPDLIVFDYYLNYLDDKYIYNVNLDEKDKIGLMLIKQYPWNKIIRKRLFTGVFFPEKKIRFQDHGTIPIISCKANKIKYLNEPLYIYNYQNPNNITKKKNKNDDIYVAFEYLVEANKNNIIPNQYMDVLYINTFVYTQIFNVLNTDYSTILKNLVKIKSYLNTRYPNWRNSPSLKFKFSNKYSYINKSLPKFSIIGKIYKYDNKITGSILYHYFKYQNKEIYDS